MSEQDEILVVDDTPIILNLLTNILSAEGFPVRSANNGELALGLIAAKPPQLILLDINMPEMDGFEVCRRLKSKEESKEIPVIFISGLTDHDVKVKGFWLGAVDFISKPFQREELLARVRTHLELNRLRTKLEAQVVERTAQLRKSAKEIEDLYNNAPCGYHSLDENGIFQEINHTELKWLGYTRAELIGEKKFSDLIASENLPTFRENFSRLKTEGFVGELEFEIIRKDGTTFTVLLNASVIYDSPGHYLMIRCNMFDITERKRAEEALRKSEELYRNILESIEEGYYEVDIAGNFTFFNDSLCNMLGYPRDELMGMNSRRYTDEENANKLYKAFNKVYLTGIPTKGFDWQVIRKDGTTRFGEISVSPIRDGGSNIIGFRGIARDITDRKQAEEELATSLNKLRKALGGIIQATASIVETRDPYTAGHQRRVSNLGRAIAQEMGLSKDQVEAVRMAGTVHDLGKISVPAEILNKPTKLSELEYGLIKVHSEAGYEILKDIEFPWPIARMVLEHHEKINGSGYPKGLKGDEILLETKVLTVADEVEAIASHRPYRPALGIDVALEEISKNRGIIYDTEVVDACLRLFKEKGFKLE